MSISPLSCLVRAILWEIRRARIVRLTTGSDASLPTARSSHLDEKSSSQSVNAPMLPSTLPNPITFRSAPPFVLSHDIPRGILLMVQVTLNYAFMLAVMCVLLFYALIRDSRCGCDLGRSSWVSSFLSSSDWVSER